MPVHLYGQCADMESPNRMAAEHKLAMIEDAAQAIGASWNGKPAGALSLAAAFSFYPTKNLSAFGDAGALTTSDPHTAERLRLLRNHGGEQRSYHHEIGANNPTGLIHAALLRLKRPHLGRRHTRGRETAASS